jgi:hypothetical protein
MVYEVDNRKLSFNPDDFVADPVEQAYRDKLGDGLEIVLADGAETLEALSEGLNSLGTTQRSGGRWTTALLEAELRRLAP